MKHFRLARLAAALALSIVIPANADGPPQSSPGPFTAVKGSEAGQTGPNGNGGSPDVHVAATTLFRPGRPWIFTLYPPYWNGDAAINEIARADLAVMHVEAVLGNPPPIDKMVARNPNIRPVVYLEILATPPQEIVANYGTQVDPAWWLLRPGTRLSSAVSASATTINVESSSELVAGDDLLIDGETVKINGVNGTSLSVQRGYYSTAASHSAGAPARAHFVGWTDSNGINAWGLNLAPDAPRAANGKRAIDFLVDVAESKMKTSRYWTGIFLSPTYETIGWLDDGRADSNLDGLEDGVPGWDAGVKELIQRIRQRLPNVPIIGQGDETGRLDLNGNIFDLFGTRNSAGEFEDGKWQQQLGAYLYWSNIERTPRVIGVANSKVGATDFKDARFSIGTFLLGEGALSYESGAEFDGTTTWFDEYDDGGRQVGYLGEPVGPAQRVLLDMGPNTLPNGDFSNGMTGWKFATESGYKLDKSISTTDTPPGAARSIVLTPSAGEARKASMTGPRQTVRNERDYTISFWAKASSPRPIQLGVQQDLPGGEIEGAFQRIYIDTQWKEYQYSFTSYIGDPTAQPIFWLADSAATVSLANIRFQEGNGDFWVRYFEQGVVLVNGGSSGKTFNAGPQYRYIKGTQDPSVNTGKTAGSVTVPPSDARILVRTEQSSILPVHNVLIRGPQRN